MPQLEQLLEPEDVSTAIKVPTATLKYWRATRQGPEFLRIGRHVRYRPSDVESWLASQARATGDAA